MFAKINSIGLFGMNAFPVAAEISTAQGSPGVEIVGLADLSVQESKLRIKAAAENCGLRLSRTPVVINLAPANVKKSGSFYDLPILTAMLAVSGTAREIPEDSAFIGEVSLSGEYAPSAECWQWR